MEYSKEFCMTTIQKIKKDNGLKWKEMAELFNYKSVTSLINLAHGAKVCDQKTFEKHFGPIEQYMTDGLVPVKTEITTDTVEQSKIVIPETKKTGIVLTAGSLPELKELLTTIGYHMEFVAI